MPPSPREDALAAEVQRLQRQIAESNAELARLRARDADDAEGPAIVGRSNALTDALAAADRVAPTDGTVLITGETGTGKDLLARRLHARSPRADHPLVALNCAALPDNLLESELFGHERGAFTGADRQRLGKFELAHRSTLFLDEIAELSLNAQSKLLRVMQDGTFSRVGGAETLHSDARLVAATHRDLAEQVRKGRFREDLYYRLHVFTIHLPPLRERTEDIRPLAEHLHAKHATRTGKPALPLADNAVRRLLAYRFPGNVRELENIIERATILADPDDTELTVDLPEGTPTRRPTTTSGKRAATEPQSAGAKDVLLSLDADQLQRLHILYALEQADYKVSGKGGAAEHLKLNPQTLLSRMDKLGIPRPRAMKQSLAQPSLPTSPGASRRTRSSSR